MLYIMSVKLRQICDPASPLVRSPASQRRDRRRLGRLAGVEWAQDILRHTAASYMLARDKDAGRVALALGNSVAILMRHYHEVVTPGAAAEFWSLNPNA